MGLLGISFPPPKSQSLRQTLVGAYLMAFIVKAALAYLESHPEQVEKLVAALIEALVNHLNAPKA